MADIGLYEPPPIAIARLIQQSLLFQRKLTSSGLGCCHKSADCANSCARRSVCPCNNNGGDATAYVAAAVMWLTMQNDGDLVDVMLLYTTPVTEWSIPFLSKTISQPQMYSFHRHFCHKITGCVNLSPQPTDLNQGGSFYLCVCWIFRFRVALEKSS